MSYCAIKVPYKIVKKNENQTERISDLSDKIMSGIKTGGLNIENVTTLSKNIGNLLYTNRNALESKFAGIGLVQLLTQGKITNETAFGYLTQGFPQALNQTAITLGFQSIEQLKTALISENGVNVGEFLQAFENAGNAIKRYEDGQKTRDNVSGFNIIEIDAVMDDTRNYASETPDRRVQAGQTYQESIHNLPDILTLQCILQNGRNYRGDDFEDIMLNLRDRKIPVTVIVGDKTKDNMVLTLFSPDRSELDGYMYTLEFKKIQTGTVDLVQINIPLPAAPKTNIPVIVENKEVPEDTKTVPETNNGYKKALKETKEQGKKWIEKGKQWLGEKLEALKEWIS